MFEIFLFLKNYLFIQFIFIRKNIRLYFNPNTEPYYFKGVKTFLKIRKLIIKTSHKFIDHYIINISLIYFKILRIIA